MSKTRSKLKMFTFILMLISICFCLAGCSQVEYTTYINDNGTIDEYLTISLDSNTLTKHGFNIEVEKLNIQTFAQDTVKNLIAEYEQKLLQDYNQTNITSEEYENYTQTITLIEQPWQNNTYVIGIQFANRGAYNKYYQLLNTSGQSYSNEEIIKKPFYTKTYYYRVSNYAKYGLFAHINEYYSTRYNSISEKTTLKYSYMVPSRRFHSNADEISVDSNGNYIHTWNIESTNLDKQLYFYTTKANAGFWVSICIVISVTITTILCTIAIWAKQPKDNNTLQENENQLTDNNT